MMSLFTLAWTFAKVSILTYGGGLASLPFLYQVFITENHWMTPQVFNETVALAQMTPGPIILNAATMLGYRFAGFVGSLVATTAVIAAPLLVVIPLVWIFHNASGRAKVWVDRIRIAMRPVVAGLLAVALWTVALPVFRNKQLWPLAAVSAGLWFVPFMRKYPQLLLILMALLGVVAYSFGVLSAA